MTDQTNTNQPAESAPIKKGVNKILLALLVIFSICLILVVVVFAKIQTNRRFAGAKSLVYQGRCMEAIERLSEIIADNPKWVEAFELRAICYQSLQSNVFSEAQGYLLAALQDANTLIKLQPQDGSWHVRRELILRDLANLEIYSVNKFAIYALANQDVERAMELGVDPSYGYVYRHYARNMIEGHHCREGLAETQKLIDQTTTQSDDFGRYYSVYLTEAYICLGDLDKALESAQYITCDDPVSTCKSGLLAEIYFQSGDYENALNTINYMINWQPIGGGWRYFIRALIHYEQGQTDLALQDLEIGDAYSWYGTGVYWYVRAKLSFDDGNIEDGIAYLHLAEQTLDIGYNPLRQKIIQELKSYGEKPIELSPNLPFTLGPIP
jgi:tetratricopeptide (TPR) repeat protein